GDRGAIVAHGDRDERSRARISIERRSEGAKERERLEIDADDLEIRRAAGVEIALHDLPVGDDEQDAPERRAVRTLALVQNDVVEDGLVERDREHLFRTEADRVLELTLVAHSLDLEDTDADAVVGDAEPDALLRQLVPVEEAPQSARQGVRVANLTGHDEAGLERLTNDLAELGCP